MDGWRWRRTSPYAMIPLTDVCFFVCFKVSPTNPACYWNSYPPNGFFALIFYCFMSVEALFFLPTSIFCTPPNPLKWLLHHLLPYPGALLALISFRRTGQALLKPIGSGTVPGGGNKWHKSHIERTFTPPPPPAWLLHQLLQSAGKLFALMGLRRVGHNLADWSSQGPWKRCGPRQTPPIRYQYMYQCIKTHIVEIGLAHVYQYVGISFLEEPLNFSPFLDITQASEEPVVSEI